MINRDNKIIEDLSQEVRFLKDQLSALHREIDSLNQVKTFPESRKLTMPAKDAELSLRQNENYLKSVSSILQSEKQSIHDFLDHVLNESIALTESKWGYLFFYSEESRLLKLNSWSKVFLERDPEKKSDVVFSVDETGVWGDAIRQRHCITATDVYVPDLLEGKISDKTIHLHSFMNIPVFSEGKIIALIGLANKDVEYKDFDVLQVTLLMDVAWKVVNRKLAEISLRKSEQNFRRSMDDSPLGIRIVTIEGDTIYANQAILKMYGYATILEFLAMSSKDRYTPESYAEYLDRKAKRKKGDKTPSEYEISIRRINGEIRYLQVIRKEVLWDGKIQYQAVYQDITEQKILYQELIKAKEKAEESDRLKSSFLMNLSHEIRTPMNAILGFSDLLKEQDLTLQERERYIEIINKSGFYLLSIINETIEFSKIETGQITLCNASFEIGAMVRDLCEEMKTTIPSGKDLDLSFSCDELILHLVVFSDEMKIRQILKNLMSNAVKFTDRGCVQVDCRMDQDGRLVFSVKDTGIGISAENQEHIFDRFWQAEWTLNNAQRGSGLGLTISKAYAEMLGGCIFVESEPGKGSTFRVILPVNTEESADTLIPGNEGVHKISLGCGQKILVVEDDESSYCYLSALFSASNYTLIRALNGEEAVNICSKNEDIALVLMDLKMPVMNGFEAYTLIKQMRPHLPVIAQTAYSYSYNREQIMKAGFDGYIAKPIKKELLFQIINSFMNC